MKILVYSHDWAPSIGGTQTVTMSLARGIAASTRESDDAPELTLVTQTLAGPSQKIPDLPFSVVPRPPLKELVRLVRSADIIHLAGPALLPMLTAKFFRKKIVVHHHNYQAVCPSGTLVHNPDRSICSNHFLNGDVAECVRCQAAEISWLGAIRKTLLAYPRLWLNRQVSANVTVSDHAKKRLALPASRTIYNGTPSDAAEIPPAISRSNARPYVAFIGRLVPDKGIGVLIGAAMKLAEQDCEVDIKIIGDGPERHALEGLVRFLELRRHVSFAGFLEGEELARAVSGAIAVVIPSICEETAGLAAIEQMMRGKLVIASDIGGLSEVIGSTGLKFAPGDAVALAQRVREALEGPEMRVRMGAAARERALAMFTEQRMIAEHAKLYEEILSVPKRAEGTARLIRVPRVPFRNIRAG